MAHATRDHILRVANEADFILKRLRAEDVSKHSAFNRDANEHLFNRKREEQVSDHLITSAKRRDFLIALKLLEKMRTILLSPSGACRSYYRLDVWEDDSRRRRRFIPNIYGPSHTGVFIEDEKKTNNEECEEKAQKENEQMLKDLAHKMMNYSNGKRSFVQNTNNNQTSELIDESDIEKWTSEENELREHEKPEQALYSTAGKLIAAGLVVPGTISITATELYFDADEEDPHYKQQDSKVSLFLVCRKRKDF